VPRSINQLALRALIQAFVDGREMGDGNLMKHVIHRHPLYSNAK
jgi:hypothetical protein